jgi:hypothetical protein
MIISIKNNISLVRITLLITFLLLTSSNCEREEFSFPYVPINLSLDLTADLGVVGVGETYTGPSLSDYGVGGLIIYRADLFDYRVYDLTCTHEPDYSCSTEEDESFDGVTECPCCGSRYLIIQNADVLEGPAVYPLVEYNAVIDGGFLRIVN